MTKMCETRDQIKLITKAKQALGDVPTVEEFMEKQFSDPEIKAVYERLADR